MGARSSKRGKGRKPGTQRGPAPQRAAGALAVERGTFVAEAPVAPPERARPEAAPVSRGEQSVRDDYILVRAGRDLMARVRALTKEQWLWVAVVLLAAVLRYWGGGDKPLHHDESMHAFYSLMFARNPSGYQYDPLLHGPFQFHAEGIVFAVILWLEGLFRAGSASGHPWINDTTARFLPAFFGTAIVALPYGLRRELGRVGAWIAALLLAVSPAFVYFSRFLRESIYFNFFMFAMVVCAVQFARTRSVRWFVGLALATVFAYATFEGIYLTFVAFFSFLGLLALWELAHSVAPRLPRAFKPRERLFLARVVILWLAGGLAGVAGILGLLALNGLSRYINENKAAADVNIVQLENTTVLLLLYASILIALLVIGVLVWQISRDDSAIQLEAEGDDGEASVAVSHSPSLVSAVERVVSAPGRLAARLRERLDPERQGFLSLLLSISWVHWFVGFVAAWILFAALYWVIPPGPAGNLTWGQGFQVGIGKGIWEGLYYWLTQQNVARGGQPVYYYALLFSLYEQLAVVFGLAGAVYSVFRPTRFRLFLVWWFVISFGLYSWAGEKMPWLSIHMLLPLMLLAGLLIGRVALQCVVLARAVRAGGWSALMPRPATAPVARDVPDVGLGVVRIAAGEDLPARRQGLTAQGARQMRRVRAGVRWVWGWLRAVPWNPVGTGIAAISAVLLFIPMVHSMISLAYQRPADAPREMMVYVQTTNDVDLVMNKLEVADQKLYGGKHQLRIWVGQGEEWPMYWYLRDYWIDPHPQTYVTFDMDVTQPFGNGITPPDVLLLTPGDAQAFMAAHPGYSSRQYALRSWWDEAYKPPPCVTTAKNPCPPSTQWGSGVGLGNYLSYGSQPPPNATFDPGRAARRLWNWLWLREPLGATTGSYDFVLVVRNGVPITP